MDTEKKDVKAVAPVATPAPAAAPKAEPAKAAAKKPAAKKPAAKKAAKKPAAKKALRSPQRRLLLLQRRLRSSSRSMVRKSLLQLSQRSFPRLARSML